MWPFGDKVSSKTLSQLITEEGGAKPTKPAPTAPADEYAGLGDVTAAAAGEEQRDEYAGLGDAAPGALDKAGAAGQSAIKAAADAGLPMAGATAGAALGAAMSGPFAPIAVPVGGLIGLGAGYLASRGVTDVFGLKSPEELPPEVRPYAYGGEAIGGSAAITSGTLTAAQAGVRTGRKFIDKLLDYAKKHPIAFGQTETAASVYSGIGGGLSEQQRPGEVLPRVAAEVGLGLFNLNRVISQAWSSGAQAIRRAITGLSSSGQETMAAQYLQRLVDEFGEDPETLAVLLTQPGLGLDVTAAQKTGSDALIALEQKLGKENTRFGQAAADKADKAMAAMGKLVDLFRGTGDPAALSAAAEVQAARFKGLIAARIGAAENEATLAAGQITADTPQARQALSTRAVALVGEALQDARAAERSLWDKVDERVPSAGQNVIEAAAALRSRMLPEESLPPLVERYLARIQGDEATPENARAAAEALFTPGAAAGAVEPTTSGELKILRSVMLDAAREASAQHRYRDAAAYGKIAEAALEDLTELFANRGDTAFDDARTFSRELHQTFTRSFADAATATTRLGAERVPPEVFLQRALGTGREMGDVRLDDLRTAVQFPAGDPAAIAQRTAEMASAQERILRLAASDAINPETGVANTRQLSAFLEKNADLLDTFPAARDAIERAVSSQQGAANLRGVLEGGQRIAERQAAFAKVLKVDSPVDAVSKAVNSAAPESELKALAKLAAKGGPAAQEGLKFSLWQDAINRATRSEALDFNALDKAMNEPLRDGLPSLMQVMQRNGLADAGTEARLKFVIAEGRKLATAAQTGATLHGMEATPSMGLDALLRIAGSKAGGQVAQAMGGGSTLIANAVGSKYLTETFKHMGGKNVMAFVLKAAEDPALMADLLRRPKTPEEGLKIAQSIHAYAIAAGLSGAQQEQPKEPKDDFSLPTEAGMIVPGERRDPKPTEVNYQGDAPALKEFPSAEDAANAEAAGFGRETGLDGVSKAVDATGKRGTTGSIAESIAAAAPKDNPKAKEVFTRAALAANRSAIAALGFSPGKTALEGSGDTLTVAGFFSPSKDVMMAKSDDPSVVVHESIHRGLKLLRDSNVLDKGEKYLLSIGEESVVRYLMATVMGDPEGSIGKLDAEQRQRALDFFDKRFPSEKDRLRSIEAKAQQLVTKRKPGGPR